MDDFLLRSNIRNEKKVDMKKGFTYLTNLEMYNTPYPHFICDKVLTAQKANQIREWLQNDIDWKYHEESFFEQYEALIIPEQVPAKVSWLFSTSSLDFLKKRVSEGLNVQLDDKIKIVAHKLTDGQSIGIHNDNPVGTLETHRLVINLNTQFKDNYGGHMIVFSKPDNDGVNAIYRPIHNTAFGFSMSQHSYHAVNKINNWERYSLVFSFWEKNRKNKSSVLLLGIDDKTLAPALEFLLEHKVDDSFHSGENLLAHLLNTYSILKDAGFPDELCKAGLFHSIYGTESYAKKTVEDHDRETIKKLIGQDAEDLAYLFCSLSQKLFYNKKPAYKDKEIEIELKNSSKLKISKSIWQNLVILDIANFIEQLPRRSDISVDEKKGEIDIYLDLVSLIPGPAVLKLKKILEASKSE